MTNQEAIETIKANYPDERYTMLREALDMAMELLKAQEPLKPIIEQEMDDVCSDIENVAYCAKCSARLGRVESYKQNYCPNCGQAVKWE